MGAFVEPLCEHCGIVRAGPRARRYGDPWTHAVIYRLEGDYAVIKGLGRKIPLSLYRSIIRAVNDTTAHLVAYDRIGPPCVRVVQLNPSETEGKIVMSKHVHHVNEAKGADGFEADAH